MKTIATYGKLDDAFLARARLEGSGVNASIPDENMASTFRAGTPIHPPPLKRRNEGSGG